MKNLKYYLSVTALMFVAMCASIAPTPRFTNWKPCPDFASVMWFTKAREGYVPKVYPDPGNGAKTGGFGCSVQKGDTTDYSNYDEATKEMYRRYEQLLLQIKKDLPDHPSHKQWAVAMLAFNMGYPSLKRKSLWNTIKSNGDVTTKWLSYCYYFDKKKGKRVRSENLLLSRKFEVSLWNNDLDSVKKMGEDARLKHLSYMTQIRKKYPV